MALDPDDPRPAYKQVTNALRAAILTEKLAPGEKLASGSELARTYGVARMTIQQAIRQLREEGLVMSRQGSGVFVRRRVPPQLMPAPSIERAFERPNVSIDFAGYSVDTLCKVIRGPLDKVRAGQFTPDSIDIRILTPDTSRPWAIPCRIDDLADEPALRQQARATARRRTDALIGSLAELADFGLVKSATVRARVHGPCPMFKLYILNGTEAISGFYQIAEHHYGLHGDTVQMYHLRDGDTAMVSHHADGNPHSTGSQYVAQARDWFDSIWTTISREDP